MEQDLKDTIKRLEEAKQKQEKAERIIILLTGLLIVVVFSIIGINLYSSMEETVSEPEVEIVGKEEIPPVKTVEVEEAVAPVPEVLPVEKQVEEKPVQKEKPVAEKPANKVVEKPKPQPQPKPKPQPKAEVKPKPKTGVKIVSPSSLSGIYVQVGAFSTGKKAEKAVKELKLPNAVILKEDRLYKVLVGSFKNRKEAFQFLEKKNIKGFIRQF
ncbi:MAG: hypothetical protein GXN94_03030 [Aquificae bacterium]|nr:hypothetical protein [Aquificota bacterium]